MMLTEPPNGLQTEQLMSVQRRLAARHDATIDLICRLVEIESPSGDLAGSRAVVDVLQEALRGIAVVDSIERIPAQDYGEHLRVHLFGGNATSGETTLLIGHTDTVHLRGTLAVQPVRAEGERLYAPGIFDMKANCALAVETLRAIAELGLAPSRPVVLLLTCDEETGSHTGRALVEAEAERAGQVLVLEPSAPGGAAKTARKGTGTWTITAHGRASHAGLNPQDGASAIRELARHIERFHSMNEEHETRARGTSFNVGTISGGTRSNVVPAEAVMEVDVRFGRMDEAARVEESMINLQAFDSRVSLRVEGGINRPPLERTPEVIGLYKRAQTIACALGFELGEESVGGASDGNFAAACGCPVLDGLGIEGGGAHASDEHIITTNIASRGALLAGLILS